MFVFVLLCILCVHSSFAIILKRKCKLSALLLLSINVTLPRGAKGLSAVCDCGIS